jgi:hypothetical protein
VSLDSQVRSGSQPRQRTITSSLVMRFDGGTVRATGTARLLRSSTAQVFRYRGSGRLTGGTGDFEGVKGRLRLEGTRPRADQPIETLRLTGSAEY